MSDGPNNGIKVTEGTTPVCGVNYICTGAVFTKAGVNSARSVRKHSPNLLIDIYTDSPSEIPDGLFDMVHLIADPHRRSKVDYMAKTRFDRSLYLDTDTRVVTDISNMFDLLDRFDLAIAHAHERNKKGNLGGWRCTIPDNFPQLNSGVMVYRRTPVVINMLSDWQAAFHTAGFNKDQVTLRELLWLSDLRIYILPPEYNVRYAKYIKVWAPNEAEPKILHFASYHHEVGVIQGLRGWRRQLQKLKNAFHDFKKKRKHRAKSRKVGRLKPHLPQVFCIGFHKTGTTSLGAALDTLGYRTIHGDGRGLWAGADEGRGLIAKIDAGDYALDTLPMFDAFLDNPYFSIWKKLADANPEARFILTQRSPDKWIESCVRYYGGRRVRPMRAWMFGQYADPASSPEAREKWLATYNKHNADILDYFADKPNFLCLNLTEDASWDSLCAFLDEPKPERPFPFLNSTQK
ncbi:hypothetical protein SAMN05421665_0032 [Yoonia rosea]|uniref:Sulfotransferase family protein n=1 Tax=Yoonia rosea TaxID=287098 RepID=A0A1R3W8K5_9RHOB|nr:sulfotransferase [Yoonia rosea]SIT74336.1 hypothetical protein SAMN05421665_0032 [Yoonia rosea]